MEMVLTTHPHIVAWLTPVLEVRPEMGLRNGQLIEFCEFWRKTLTQVKDRSLKINAFSEIAIRACMRERISTKILDLTLIDNCTCKRQGKQEQGDGGSIRIRKLKILVVKPDVEEMRKKESSMDYLGIEEFDRSGMPGGGRMGYQRARRHDEIGALLFFLELNSITKGTRLTIEEVIVSAVLLREQDDTEAIHWHNTFVPDGASSSSWKVASYVAQLLSHFNQKAVASQKTNSMTSGLQNITLQTCVLFVEKNMRFSRSSCWERKVGAMCHEVLGPGNVWGCVHTTQHLQESLFNQMALLNIGAGPPEFLMGMPCGLGPNVDTEGQCKSSIQIALCGEAHSVGLRANTQRALLRREKGEFVLDVLHASRVSHVPSVPNAVNASKPHTHRDFSMCDGVNSKPGDMPLVHEEAACFGWRNQGGVWTVYDLYLF